MRISNFISICPAGVVFIKMGFLAIFLENDLENRALCVFLLGFSKLHRFNTQNPWKYANFEFY